MNRKPKKKLRWLWIVVIIVVVSVIFAINESPGEDNDANNPSAEKAKVTEAISSKIPDDSEISNDTASATTFDEIYYAYKENELVADDLYKHNRYRVTAKINHIANDGLFNLTGGATLTMETKIDNTVVFFYAEFEKDQEEALKTVKVGDTITFDGECLSAGSWIECELVGD